MTLVIDIKPLIVIFSVYVFSWLVLVAVGLTLLILLKLFSLCKIRVALKRTKRAP